MICRFVSDVASVQRLRVARGDGGHNHPSLKLRHHAEKANRTNP